jgi:hypothetical protein
MVLFATFASQSWTGDASAQQYLIGAAAGVSSGIEGGGAQGGFARARTRLRLGGDLRIDESPDDIFEFAALAEIEPHSSFGATVGYARAAGQHFVVDAAVLGFFAPASLYGVSAGLAYRLPISKRAAVAVGPEGDFYFLGTDLPDGTVVWEVRIQGGLRVDL